MRYEVGTNVVLVDNVPLEEASPLALKGYKGLGSALMAFEQGGVFIVPHSVTRGLGFCGLIRITFLI